MKNTVIVRRGRRTAQLKHSKCEKLFVKTHNNSYIMLCCCLKKVMDNIVDFYKNNCKNKNTTKATNSWLRTYKHIGIVIVEFYIGIVIVEFYIGIVIVEFYIGIVLVEFLNHYYFFIAYSTDVSYYICLVVAIVNAINILTHGFGCNIDLSFSLFYFLSYLALALTCSGK